MKPSRILAWAVLPALVACSRPAAPQAAPALPVAAASAGQAVNPPANVALYHCADGQAIEAGYPDRDTAVVTYNGHAYPLKSAAAASGVRYVGYGLQWWTKGMTQATLSTLKPGETVASDAGVTCSTQAAEPVSPPAPGTPGGLPSDRTPVSEAPFSPTSAQGAANVVQTYYALVEAGKYAEAAKLRSDGRAEDFSAYASHHAQVGAPGEAEGAAGSIYVEVPVVIYGRLKTGAEVHRSGKAVLRRVNDVPGSTAEQRRWRIERVDLRP
ncbi:MliC family protein [Phenylobacterium hankyongense]|uniref:MliC family protein n=1 Tax=Phenylobacterium hankyongense TaxID=1813876 RepID=UPI001A9FF926|nr:MliC family protein [Phenylobacterium hankyongense]